VGHEAAGVHGLPVVAVLVHRAQPSPEGVALEQDSSSAAGVHRGRVAAAGRRVFGRTVAGAAGVIVIAVVGAIAGGAAARGEDPAGPHQCRSGPWSIS
jgi:hypothetical protein